MDLHKQKRPLGDNKLCKTGSKVDIKNDYAGPGDFSDPFCKSMFSSKKKKKG